MGYLRILSVLFISGALALLVFNGITLWHSAYELNTSKFPIWAAWSAVGALTVECLGLAASREFWRVSYIGMALMTALFTFACAGYLLRLDINTNVAGRADREAVRESSIEDRRADREELATQKSLRDRLQAKAKLTADERRALSDARRRIIALDARWGAHAVVAQERTPDASWISRWLGIEVQSADDYMQALPLLVGVLIRLMCMPIGLALWSMAGEAPPAVARSKPSSTSKPGQGDEEDGLEEAEGVSPPVHAGERLGPNGHRVTRAAVPRHLNEAVGRRAPTVYDTPPSRIARAASQAQTTGSVPAFIQHELIQDDAPGERGRFKYYLKASRAYEAYQLWCATRAGGGISALDAAQFGKAFKEATGRPAVVRGNGAFYAGWRLKTEVALEGAGRSTRGKDAALAASA